jgi:circadian clock protein KaiB
MELTLFITGSNPNHARTVAHLESLCEQQLNGQCDLEVIDVCESPQRAEKDKVLATPALIKQWPLPVQRMIGDFSSSERVLMELGVRVAADDIEQGMHNGPGAESTDVAAYG